MNTCKNPLETFLFYNDFFFIQSRLIFSNLVFILLSAFLKNHVKSLCMYYVPELISAVILTIKLVMS